MHSGMLDFGEIGCFSGRYHGASKFPEQSTPGIGDSSWSHSSQDMMTRIAHRNRQERKTQSLRFNVSHLLDKLPQPEGTGEAFCGRYHLTRGSQATLCFNSIAHNALRVNKHPVRKGHAERVSHNIDVLQVLVVRCLYYVAMASSLRRTKNRKKDE